MARCYASRGSMRFWQKPRQPFVGLAIFAAIGVACADRFVVDVRLALSGVALFAALALWRRTAVAVWLLIASVFFLLHHFRWWENSARRLDAALAAEHRGGS